MEELKIGDVVNLKANYSIRYTILEIDTYNHSANLLDAHGNKTIDGKPITLPLSSLEKFEAVRGFGI